MNFYEDYVIAQHKTGSNYICNPPVTDTDIDTVILVRSGYEHSLQELGWQYQMSDIEYEAMGSFTSWRKGNKNYIVTQDKDFYDKFVKATRCAKILNLMNKQDRIMLFSMILYQWPSQIIPPAPAWSTDEVPF